MLDRLNEDMKIAMRERDKLTLTVIRMTKAAIERKAMDERKELSETEVIDVIAKQIKTREDSITEFKKGGREDLIAATEEEIVVLQKYMPTPLTEAELDSIITDAIKESDATSLQDLGNVMKIITPQVKGKCDMKSVSTKVRNHLS